MRYVRYFVFLVIAVVLIVLSVANRHVVTIYSSPDLTEYGAPPVQAYDVPLFIVPLAALAVGFLLGVVWEFFREGATRRRLRTAAKEAETRAREAEKRAGPAPKSSTDEDLMAISAG